jgi:hypothetical protein
MFSPVDAEVWKYSYPFFLAYAIASADSTYLALLSDLFPNKYTTHCFKSNPLLFIAFYQRLIFWKDCLLPTSKTNSTICEC